jgi:hypothetical protein
MRSTYLNTVFEWIILFYNLPFLCCALWNTIIHMSCGQTKVVWTNILMYFLRITEGVSA